MIFNKRPTDLNIVVYDNGSAYLDQLNHRTNRYTIFRYDRRKTMPGLGVFAGASTNARLLIEFGDLVRWEFMDV